MRREGAQSSLVSLVTGLSTLVSSLADMDIREPGELNTLGHIEYVTRLL